MAITKIGQNLWQIKISVRVKGKDYPVSKQEQFSGTKIEAEMRRTELIKQVQSTCSASSSLKTQNSLKYFSELLSSYRENLRITGKLSVFHEKKIDFLEKELGHISIEEFPSRFEVFIRIYRNTPTIHGKKRGPASANRLIEIVKAAFNHGVKTELLERNLIIQARFPKGEEKPRDRYLTETEEDDLLKAIKEHRSYLLPFIQYSLSVPCRKNELVNAKREQYNHFTNTIYIPDSKAGIPIHKPVPESMITYFRNIPSDCPYLFFRKDEHGYHPLGDFKKAWAYCLKKANLQNYRVHDLRHKAVTSLIELGNSESIVADAAGWTSTKMLKNYRHINTLKSAQAVIFQKPLDPIIKQSTENA